MQTKTKSLDVDLIRDSILKDQTEGFQYKQLHYFECIDSTNDWLLSHGSPGDICIAEEQTAGKGRRGNQWLSPNSENVYFSVCFELNKNVSHQSLLGLVVSIAIAEALSDFGITGHGIKWPNDIYIFRKKVGGVLIETRNQTNTFIIGVGLNYKLPENVEKQIDQDVTSISESINSLQNKYNRLNLFITLFKSLSQFLSQFAEMDFHEFKRNWDRWDILKGELISFNQAGSKVTGTVCDIDEHGRIGIRHPNDEVKFYSSADIRLNKG